MKTKLLGRRAIGKVHCFRPSVWGLFLALWGLLCPVWLSAQVTRQLWVGESFTCDVSSAVMGLTSDMSWSVSGGYVSLSGTGFYRTATVTQYFSGSAIVTCKWKYRLYSGDTWSTQSRSWTFTCQDNPVSISPTSLTLAPGEQAYVRYSLRYSTNASSAQAYFSSSDPNVATVSASGYVTAVAPGTTYINVYSKVSANAPYCVVTVENPPVKSASLPTKASIVAGESVTLSLSVNPTNGNVETQSWYSSNTTVATVSSRGVVRGIKPGTAEVYCLVNGTVRSNVTTVTVTPATLGLTAKTGSGHVLTGSDLVPTGSDLVLTASDPDATIYYTTDGTEPSTSSTRYTGPIRLTSSVTLKAVAKHEDYYDSPVLTLQLDVDQLPVIATYPQEGAEDVNSEVVPMLTYLLPVIKDEDFGAIELRRVNNDESVPGRVLLSGQTICYVPDERLDGGTYTLTIPAGAVQSEAGEPNRGDTLAFSVQAPPTGVVQICLGNLYTSYLLDTAGDLWAWGNATYGPFGPDQIDPVLRPRKVFSGIAKIYKTDYHAAALTRSGDLYLWGENKDGRVGDGTTADKKSPVRVLSDVTDVALSDYNSYALKADGTLWAWGMGDYGAVGNGSTTDCLKPVQILDDVQAVYAGLNHDAFALKKSGELMAWGRNSNGQLGVGTQTDCNRPTQVNLDNVDTLAVDYHSTYALTKSGELWAWGYNFQGNLGLGTTENALTPQRVMDGVRRITTGYNNAWALKDDGSLWAWGHNSHGTQGTGTTDDVHSPRKVMDDVCDVVSEYITVVLKNDDSLWACGYLLGPATYQKVLTFKPVQLSADLVGLAVNGTQGAYITTAGELWTWGPYYLGDGTKRNRYFTNDKSLDPVRVFPLPPSQLDTCTLSTESLSLTPGTEAVLRVLADPITAPLYVTWRSEDRTVATVSDRGVIEGINPGSTRVTAYVSSFADSPDFIGIYTCDVTVSEVPAGIESTESAPFAVRVEGNHLWVEGLVAGETVRLYDVSGRLCDETTATGSSTTIEAGPRGVYVVRTDGGRATKVTVR